MPRPYIPAQLTDADWERLRAVFAEDEDILFAISELRSRKNLPQLQLDLFPIGKSRSCAHEYINNTLRLALMPYRITRIGSWARPFNHRRLAIVPWGVGTQVSMQLIPRYEPAS